MKSAFSAFGRIPSAGLALAIGMLLVSLSLFSQANFGRILGAVRDQSGAVIAGARITVLDTERGIARTLTTDEVGEYDAPTLTPGTYTVRAEAQGFKKLERQKVVVEVGKEIRVDVILQPGEQEETVTVSESIPLVETTSATLGGTLNNESINDLPLNGRNFQSLMPLRPGVMIQPGAGPWSQSTNNLRPDESVWMVDGVINENFSDARPVTNMPSPFTDGATVLPIDAIQEFNLEENPKAEYGWFPGAVVNVGVKSGTNALHSSVYAFGRNGSWDARNYFNPAPTPALDTSLQQFGGVVGGPIKKDKLFFFGGYEALRSSIGNAIAANVPETASQATAANPAGDPANSLVDALNAVRKAGLTPSAVSMGLLGCTPSGATFACTGGLIQNASANNTSYLSNFPNSNTSDNGIGKIDYHLNTNNTINGMLFVGNYSGIGMDHPFVNKIFEDNSPIRSWSAVGNWIWTPNSAWVNDVRIGYNRVSIQFAGLDTSTKADGKGFPINSGLDVGGLPNVNILGFASIGTWHNRPQKIAPNPYWDFQDNVSYLRGRHTFKFGGELTHMEGDGFFGDTIRGRIDFRGNQTAQIANSTPLEDFFAGIPSRGFVLVGNPSRKLTWTTWAAFAQDDWRVTPKLTLNLGLRYSYSPPMNEASGLMGNFDPAAGMVQQGSGNNLWNADHKDFSPRAGFAWDVTGRGTTVVRGGASLIYTTFLAAMFLAETNLQNSSSTSIAAVPTGADLVVNGVTTPGASKGIELGSALIPGSKLNWNGVVFPTGSRLQCGDGVKLASGATDPNPCNILAVDKNLVIPYVTSWTLDVEHAFGNNLSLELGYVGNHGSRLIGFRDINQPDLATGVHPFAKYPYLGFINQISNDAVSNYNSLQATLTKRLSHGLSFLAGYTYGHGLDNGSLNRWGYLPQDSRNPGAEYASGDFDIRHRLTFTATYELPGKNGFGQMLKGWKVNTILSLQTGQPWLISDTGNNFSGSGESADRWDFFGNPGDFKSSAISIPYCTGPGAGGCTQTSGIVGATIPFSAADSTAMWAKCTAKAPDPSTLATGGCYVVGNSVMVPPTAGTFGTMGRNIFRDSGFKNVDFSVFKMFTFTERLNAQFRVELFNLFNHPNIANPFGSINGWQSGWDPSAPATFGCGCATPDVAAGNPVVGSGSARVLQLGFKLVF